jgi:hypothetical protein
VVGGAEEVSDRGHSDGHAQVTVRPRHARDRRGRSYFSESGVGGRARPVSVGGLNVVDEPQPQAEVYPPQYFLSVQGIVVTIDQHHFTENSKTVESWNNVPRYCQSAVLANLATLTAAETASAGPYQETIRGTSYVHCGPPIKNNHDSADNRQHSGGTPWNALEHNTTALSELPTRHRCHQLSEAQVDRVSLFHRAALLDRCGHPFGDCQHLHKAHILYPWSG